MGTVLFYCNKLCAWRCALALAPVLPRGRRSASRGVAVLSHAEYVPTLTTALAYTLRPR